MLSASLAIALCHQSRRFIAFRGDHLSVLPGVTGGQGVLLGPFLGICLILCWHLIYLITMVSPPTPTPNRLRPAGLSKLKSQKDSPYIPFTL